MPHYWESSSRPLFVKTVYVNGNRHAILSQEDPLMQPEKEELENGRKQSRSDSSLSFSSNFSADGSSDGRRSNSKITIEISKSRIRQPRRLSKDISSELQRCLIKLRFPSGEVRENKEEPETNKKIKKSNFEKDGNAQPFRGKVFSKQRGKRWNHGKANKKRDRELKRNNFVSECEDCFFACNLERDEKKVTKIDSESSKLKCNCEKNRCHQIHELHGFDQFRRSASLSANSEAGEQPKSHYFYSLTESSPSEFYWNSYLTGCVNSSLTERVIRWMDLTKKQKKSHHLFIGEEESLESLKREPAGKANSVRDPEKAKNYGIGKKIDRNFLGERKNSNEKFYSEKVGDQMEMDFFEKIQMENPDLCSDHVKYEDEIFRSLEGESSFAQIPFKKEEMCENSSHFTTITTTTMESIAEKVDPFLSKAVNLQESIANRFQSIYKSDSMVPEEEILSAALANLKSSTDRRKKIFGEHRNYSIEEGEYGSGKELGIKSIRIWEKSGLSRAENQMGESATEKREKSESEIARGGKSIIETVENSQIIKTNNKANAIATNESNGNFFAQKNLRENNGLLKGRSNQQSWDCFSPKIEGRGSACGKSEEKLGRPQLHVFIPTVPRDFNDESLSECESLIC